ncbi:Plug domain-containing protein [Sandaracinobacter neustonicus]|uniref:Plug domain-containing protein n=1 Tax=Sandaracinobacter neustonicus TaxID=1715348 RepID=UPI0015E3FE4D|nr:Plug domain-containing protein [Sandaracinobacter neustonicus]
MMYRSTAATAAFALFAFADAATAGETPAPEPQAAPNAASSAPASAPADSTDGEDIIVSAGIPRGSVVSDIKPDMVLNAADVRAYGASSLQDLLTQLSPQTGSGRGRGGEMPVVLMNGRRISGFQEMRSIPPEAIVRVEILPEETALAYGYRADQRVVNFVLRERFRAVTGELELGMPTAGGRHDMEIETSMTRIDRDTRTLIDFSLDRATRLLESDRSILQTATALPYALGGNIIAPVNGDEIDPALSALAGQTVTVAAVPASAANGTASLGDFANGANAPNNTDIGRYRTLLPQSLDLTGGASMTRPLSTSVQMTLSARLASSSSESRLGLPTTDVTLPAANPFSPFTTDTRLVGYSDVRGPLVRDSDEWTGRLAAAFNGDTNGWRWSVTASHDHNEYRTLTDRSLNLSESQARLDALDPTFNPFAVNALNGPLNQDRSGTNTDRSLVEAVANKRLIDLPAGALSTSFKLGLDHRDFDSYTRRSGLEQETNLKRTQGTAQMSVDLPLTSRRREVGAFLGDLSLNGNIESDQLSDFGNLITWGGGITWRPVEITQFIASYTSEQGAPSIQQLGNPLVTTPNVRVFDYATGETVEISRLDGGNADLSADRRQVWKLGGRINPIKDTDFSLQADYVKTRITGPIAGFPTATAEIEAAFPERFLRDADGKLLLIDNRPVNFERSDKAELRWGVNFSQRIKPTQAEQAAMAARRAEFEKLRAEAQASGKPIPGVPAWMQQRPQGAPMGGGGPGGPGGPGGGPRGPMGGGAMGEGRFQFSLFHTWRFTDTILIRDGVPELDLLNGSATGSSGGVPRHLVEARATINKSGLGARASLNWQSGTDVLVNPGGAPSAEDLHFSDLTTVNLRLWADLGQRFDLVRKAPWLRGTRIAFGVDNLFDQKMSVRSRDGVTPINYQPDLIDPIGRRVEVSIRKLFF